MIDAPPTVHISLPWSAPLDTGRLAEAIRQVENADLSFVGPAGERGVYQITPDVWRKHSSAPHRWASSSKDVCRAETYRVVLRHLDHLRVQLATAVRPPLPDTPYFVALAYGAGRDAAITFSASNAKRDYAARVQNIYLSK